MSDPQTSAASAASAASDPTSSTAQHYTEVADRYGVNWGDGDNGDADPYPANRLRWELVRHRLHELGVRTVLEAGCGEGSPLKVLLAEGFDVYGFDAVPAMIEAAWPRVDKGRVWVGDITDRESFESVYAPLTFDAVLALGPFPHLTDAQQQQAIANCAFFTRPGGRVFVELRNELFALFTGNGYTTAYFQHHFLPDDTPDVIRAQYDWGQPPPPSLSREQYGSTFSRFNDLLNLDALFEPAGLRVVTIAGYHFHPTRPRDAVIDPEWFRRAALAMEWPTPGYDRWPRLFQASAVVVEAVRY